MEQPRRGVGRQPVVVVAAHAHEDPLPAIAVVVHELLAGVDRLGLRPAEGAEVAIDPLPPLDPVREFRFAEQGVARRPGHEIDDVVRRHIARPADHVAHGAVELAAGGKLSLLESGLGGGEIEDLDHAAGIEGPVAGISEAGRSRRRQSAASEAGAKVSRVIAKAAGSRPSAAMRACAQAARPVPISLLRRVMSKNVMGSPSRSRGASGGSREPVGIVPHGHRPAGPSAVARPGRRARPRRSGWRSCSPAVDAGDRAAPLRGWRRPCAARGRVRVWPTSRARV